MRPLRHLGRLCAVGLGLATGLGPALAGSLYHVDRAGQRLEVVAGNRLVKAYPSGAVDGSFGGPRGLSLASGAAAVLPSALAVDAQGRILVAGMRLEARGAPAGAVVVRLLPDGTPDKTWGREGVAAEAPLSGPFEIADVAVLLDGSVAVLANVGGLQVRPALWRLGPQGELGATRTSVSWSGPSARGLGLASAGPARLMVAVETTGQREQQLYAWATGDAQALPELVARQVLPPDFRTPVPRLDGRRWIWAEGEEDNGEMAVVQFTAREAVAPKWWGHGAQVVPAAAAVVEPAGEGHVAFSPFAEARPAAGSEPSPVPAEPDEGPSPLALSCIVLAAMAAAGGGWLLGRRTPDAAARSASLARGAR